MKHVIYLLMNKAQGKLGVDKSQHLFAQKVRIIFGKPLSCLALENLVGVKQFLVKFKRSLKKISGI